jgi:class 3 adenylate cyclase
MCSIFLLMFVFDVVYFGVHKSVPIFLSNAFFYFLLYGIVSLVGAYFIYRPIDKLWRQKFEVTSSKKRIERLTWYSTGWIFLIGIIYTTATVSLLFFFPGAYSDADVFSAESLPTNLVLSFIPSLFFVHAIFPAFITWFLINDFNLDLKAIVFADFKILFSPGKKKVVITLLFVFLVLGLLPTLLVILDLVSAENMKSEFEVFTTMNPIETTLVDRVIALVGMLIAVVLIARSFTKPIYALLKHIKKVREGDFSTQAAVLTEDEIGVLTNDFNQMVKGLKEREFMKDTFGKYLTKDVVSVVLNQKIDLAGEERECTILVTDIENYTSISESLPPKETVLLLNAYFSVVVDIIQQHQGVVNKFIGDSLFAMFNVPLDDPEHAIHAIQAAIAIEKITESATFGNNQKLSTRIGINTGDVVAGNIGSADRMEYTVIGDDVNIASRLEQLNKQYGTRILVGENTYALAKDHFQFLQIGNVQLEGKEKKVKVYRLANQ